MERIILFKDYVKTLFDYSPWKSVAYLLVMILAGLTQGISLLLIIPILNFAGVMGAGGELSGVMKQLLHGFEQLGVSLTLVNVLLVYCGLVTVSALLKRQQSVLINAYFQERFVAYLRTRVYARLVGANWEYFAGGKTSVVTALLTSEINRIGISIYYFLSLISDGVLLGVHIVISFMLSAALSGVAVLTGVIIFAAMVPLHKKVSRTAEAARTFRLGLFSNISEHLGGMKLSKSMGMEAVHVERFERMSNGICMETERFARINANTQLLHTVSSVLALSVLCYYSIAVAHVEPSLLLVLIYIYSRMVPRFAALQRNMQHFVRALPVFAAVRAFEQECMREKEQLVQDGAIRLPLEREISIQGVSFRYQGRKQQVLSDCSIKIPARQTTAVVGASGVGKSTLADLLLGLLRPQQGCVLVDDTVLDDATLASWRRSISYVPQDTYLFHDTIRSNVQWAAPGCDEASLWDVLRMAGAADFVIALPEQLDTVVGDRGMRLSGGERQRIALARALLRKPELLILGEAMNALDAENERYITKAIGQLHGKLTILLITHRESSLSGVDQIVNLAHIQ